MSAPSIFRNSDMAVLVTAPRTQESPSDGGAVHVEPERYDTVTTTVDAEIPSKNPFARFFESKFGGEPKGEAQEMKELDSVKIVSPPVSMRDTVGGFDICKEYSYSGDELDDDNDSLTELERDACKSPEEENLLSTYVLGKVYHPVQDYTTRRSDEASLFWFTYRCDFPEIAPYNISSDAGWGCMLRSAQMMLAQALRIHYKGRNWKPPQTLAARRQDPFMRSMLSWFADFPSSSEHMYSLHNMVAAGLAKYDKLPGEWYGPGTACYVLRDLVELHERQQSLAVVKPVRMVFRVHVASHGSCYRDEIENLMTREASRVRKEKDCVQEDRPLPEHPLDRAWEEELVESLNLEWDTALLLLVPLRFGLKNFNEEYVRAVAHTFSLPQSVGVLGGRPRGARWFYGAVSDGSKIFGLDPHTVQNAPRKRMAVVNGTQRSIVEMSDEYLRSAHTTFPEVFSLLKMDPSVALGFYCESRQDLENVFSSLRRYKKENPSSPDLFTVADCAPSYSATSGIDDMMMANMTGSLLDETEEGLSDEDEYVVL